MATATASAKYGYSAQYIDNETGQSIQLSKPNVESAEALKYATDMVGKHEAKAIVLKTVNVFPMASVPRAQGPGVN